MNLMATLRALLVALFLLANLASSELRGPVLCFESDGCVEIESSCNGRCSPDESGDPDSSPPSESLSVRDTCVDLPLATDAAPVTAPDRRDSHSTAPISIAILLPIVADMSLEESTSRGLAQHTFLPDVPLERSPVRRC